MVTWQLSVWTCCTRGYFPHDSQDHSGIKSASFRGASEGAKIGPVPGGYCSTLLSTSPGVLQLSLYILRGTEYEGRGAQRALPTAQQGSCTKQDVAQLSICIRWIDTEGCSRLMLSLSLS